MSLTYQAAYGYIQKSQWDEAKNILIEKGDPRDPQLLYLLSLLHRYDDDYDKELEVIKRALEIDSANTYMRDRLSWHNLPIFDRVVPRQSLCLPRDPRLIPGPEVLENMCFVTGADSNYFQFMVECIESIKATRLYKDIPIFVLDCGLTEVEKSYLQNSKDIKDIKDLSKICPNSHDGFKRNNRVRAVLHKIFPGKRYYFFMDADAWIYNENCIDLFLFYAQKYGIGIAQDLCCPQHGKFYGFHGCNTFTLVDSLLEESILKNAPAINSGAYCIDSTSEFQKTWETNLEACVAQKGHQTFTDQATLAASLGQVGITDVLPSANNYLYMDLGKPAYLKNNLMHANNTEEVIGVMHAAGGSSAQLKYTYYQIPAATPEGRLTTKVSYRYRVWPWADKAQICELLLNR